MHRTWLLAIVAGAIACSDDEGNATGATDDASTTSSSSSSGAETDTGTSTSGDTTTTEDGSSTSGTTSGGESTDTTSTSTSTESAGESTTEGSSTETGAFDCEFFQLNAGESVCAGGEHSSEVALCLDGGEAYAECNFGYWCASQDPTHADCVCNLLADALCPDGGKCPKDPDCA